MKLFRPKPGSALHKAQEIIVSRNSLSACSMTIEALPCAVLIAIMAFSHGFLHTISTDWMIGYGWLCFVLWFVMVVAADPFRVRGNLFLRRLAHSNAALATWAWFFLALSPADVWSRHDTLWMAYFSTAISLALWKAILHKWLLRQLIRGALRESPRCPALRSFALGDDPCSIVPRAGVNICTTVLLLIVRLRKWPPFARFHAWLYGLTGISRIAVQEVQRATDRRVRTLRNALAKNDQPLVRAAALDLADAFACEAEIVVGTLEASKDPLEKTVIRCRALLVLEPLLLAWLTTDGASRESITIFDQVREKWGDASPHTWLTQRGMAGLLTLNGNELFHEVRQDWDGTGHETFVAGMALAASCIGQRYFRLANSVLERALGSIAEEMPLTTEAPLREQAARVSHALAAEIAERSCLAAGEESKATTPETARKQILEIREQNMGRHSRAGHHPRLAADRDREAGISTALAGQNPPPKQPREIGRSFAAFCLILLVLGLSLMAISNSPLTNRIQSFHDVPFGEPVALPNLTAAELVEPTSTLLLGDDEDGVRTINLKTFRLARETGLPPSGPGGKVGSLAAAGSDAAFALVESQTGSGPGLAVRDGNGAWRTLIAEPGCTIAGKDVAAFVPGLDHPLLLLKEEATGKEARRIVEYDEELRVLRFTQTSGAQIEGQVIDVAGSTASEGKGSAVVATNPANKRGARCYLLTQANENNLKITALPPVPGKRQARGVALGPEGTIVLLCDDGSVWQAKRPEESARWQQIRSGSQDIALDQVHLAGIAEGRKQVWTVTGNHILMRPLPGQPESPNRAIRWLRGTLPDTMNPVVPGRTVLSELSGSKAGVLLVTPMDTAAQTSGSATLFQDAGASGQLTSVDLNGGWSRILDVDSDGNRTLLLVESQNSDDISVRSLLEYGATGPKSGTQPSLLAAMTVSGKNKLPLPLDRPIAAIGNGDAHNTVVFHDGRFLRFNGNSDTVLHASQEKEAIIGRIKSIGTIRDGDITAGPIQNSETATLLDTTGSIYQTTLGLTDMTPSTLLVNTASAPTAMEFEEATGVLSDGNGFTFATRDNLWRFDLRNQAVPWSSRPTGFDTAKAPLFTIDPTGKPLVIALSRRANEVLAFGSELGAPYRWSVEGIFKLTLGAGVAAFGHTDTGLVSLSQQNGVTQHLRSTTNGPEKIYGATIRPGHIDFLARGTLHSFSRKTGEWAQSQSFGNDYDIRMAGDPAAPALLLVPKERGIPWGLQPGRPASDLTPLGNTVLRGAIPISDGVLGHTESNGLAFISVNGVQRSISPTTNNLEVNKIDEALAFMNSFWLRSANDGSLVEYDPLLRKSQKMEISGVQALEASERLLFAATEKAIHMFDGKSWRKTEEKNLLSVGYAHGLSIPTILLDGSLNLVSGGENPSSAEKTPLLVAPAEYRTLGASTALDRIIALGDELRIYSGKQAFKRGASGQSPFEEITTVNFATRRALLQSDEIWLESKSGWMREHDGLQLGTSMGWIPQAGLITIGQETGMLSDAQGQRLNLFTPAPPDFGKPREYHRMEDDRVLMLGSGNVAIFDPKTRNFLPLKGNNLPPFGNGTTVHQLSNTQVLHSAAGHVFTLRDNSWLEPKFNGARVSSFATDAGNHAIAIVENTAVDADGRPLAHQIQSFPATRLDVRQAISHDELIVRLSKDGSVDTFNPVTAQRKELLPWVPISTMGLAGKQLLFRKRGSLEVVDEEGGMVGNSQNGWFGGHGSVVYANPQDGIMMHDGTGVRHLTPPPKPLPGEIVASAPGAATVLCRIGKDRYHLFDLLTSQILSTSPLEGAILDVTTDGYFLVKKNGASFVVTRISPQNGETISSAPLQHIFSATTENGAPTLLSSLATQESTEIAHLDSKTLKPSSSILTSTRFCQNVTGRGGDSVALQAEIDGSSQLIVGDRLIIFDSMDKNVKPFALPNPLKTREVKLFTTPEDVFLVDREGRTEHIAHKGHNAPGWSAVNDKGEVLDANGDPVQRPLLSHLQDRILGVLGLKQSVKDGVRQEGGAGQELETKTVRDTVNLSIGTLELSTGWLLGDRIEDFRATAPGDVFKWRDGLGNWHPLGGERAQSARLPGGLSLPLAMDPVHGLILNTGNQRIIIGTPEPGKVLPHHKIMACALIGPNNVIVIDSLGQLWQVTPQKGASFIIPAVSGFRAEKFGVDNSGALVAYGKTGKLSLDLQGGEIRSRLYSGKVTDLLPDFLHLNNKGNGIISWRTFPDGVDFSLTPKGGKSTKITATTNGFDCFKLTTLAKENDNRLLGRLALDERKVYVPVSQAGVDWKSARVAGPNAAIKEIVAPRPLSPAPILKLSDGTALSLGPDQFVRTIIDGQHFDFKDGRFTCDAYNAVSNLGNDLVTVSPERNFIIRRSLAPSPGAPFQETTLLPGPSAGADITGLSPGDTAGSIIARTNQTSWAFNGQNWRPYTAPRFIATPGARWSWQEDKGMFFNHDGVEYQMAPSRRVAFTCDSVDSEPGLEREAAIALANGSVIYRGYGGAWFSIREGGMPKPASEPGYSAPKKSTVAWLTVDRTPVLENTAPRFRIDFDNAPGINGLFGIRNGVFEATDDWSRSFKKMLRAGKKTGTAGPEFAILPCRDSRIERRVTIDGNKLTVSPPRPRASDGHGDERYLPVTNDGVFEITDGYHCKKLSGNGTKDIDLGKPTQEGFALFSPERVTPLGVSQQGDFFWAFNRKLFTLGKYAPQQGVELIGPAPRTINEGFWAYNGVTPQFLLGGTGYSFDSSTGTLSKNTATRPERPSLMASLQPNSLKAAFDEKNMVLRIERDDPAERRLQLNLSVDASRRTTSFAHQAAQRVTADGSTVKTFSDSWQTTYTRNETGALELVAVTEKQAGMDPPSDIVLQGNLLARHTTKGYEIEALSTSKIREKWSLKSLLGPSRVFWTNDGSIVEMAKNWWRVRRDGKITSRHWGSPLPDIEPAYRAGDFIASNDVLRELGSGGEIRKAGRVKNEHQRGYVSNTAVKPWKIELPGAGGSCTISYQGRELAITDGALDMDYAIGLSNDDSRITIIDRSGSEIFPSTGPPWTMHREPVLSHLAKAKPAKVYGRDPHDFTKRGLLVDSWPGSLLPVPVPSAPGELLSLSSARHNPPILRSWTGGKYLKASIDIDNNVWFQRTIGTDPGPVTVDYPPFALKQALSQGRFAFDDPRDIYTARIDGSQSKAACVETRKGFELFGHSDMGPSTMAITFSPPSRIPTVYSRTRPAAEWFSHYFSEGDGGPPAAEISQMYNGLQSTVDKPLLWCPIGSRLFVFGASSAAWIEMSSRWENRPYKR